jgi:hypothetical protein
MITRMKTGDEPRQKRRPGSDNIRQSIEMRRGQASEPSDVSPLTSPVVAALRFTVLSGGALIIAHEKMTERVISTHDPSDDREHERDRCEP